VFDLASDVIGNGIFNSNNTKNTKSDEDNGNQNKNNENQSKNKSLKKISNFYLDN